MLRLLKPTLFVPAAVYFGIDEFPWLRGRSQPGWRDNVCFGWRAGGSDRNQTGAAISRGWRSRTALCC
jgi:hypothetical protein